MYLRRLSRKIANNKKSLLLIGPRQTGKSTLIRSLKPDLEINLAHEGTFLQYVQNPLELETRIQGRKTIFIDEIQRLPRLTNTVQTLLDRNKSLRFYLTGSSARKLRRSRANLLPGRIFSYQLGPLCFDEIGEAFDLERALSTGLLPGIYSEESPLARKEELTHYSALYLKEEIAAEGFVKNLEGFARFLRFAAASAGDLLDLSKVSAQALVQRSTATRFFEILEDTLIVRRCPAYAKSERSRLIQHPKFFFFDNGVWNGLLRNFAVSDDRKGKLFESFIFNQIYDLGISKGADFKISHYRTEHGAEVDLVVEYDGQTFAIEVKASTNVGKSDLRGFASFDAFRKKRTKKYVFYLGQEAKTVSGIDIVPWREGLELFK